MSNLAHWETTPPQEQIADRQLEGGGSRSVSAGHIFQMGSPIGDLTVSCSVANYVSIFRAGRGISIDPLGNVMWDAGNVEHDDPDAGVYIEAAKHARQVRWAA